MSSEVDANDDSLGDGVFVNEGEVASTEDETWTPGVTGPPTLVPNNPGPPHDIVMQLALTIERPAKGEMAGDSSDQSVRAANIFHPELIHDNAGPHDVMQLAPALERTANKGVVPGGNAGDNAPAGSLEQFDAECEPYHPSAVIDDSMDNVASKKVLGHNSSAVVSVARDRQRTTSMDPRIQSSFNHVTFERDYAQGDEGQWQSSQEGEMVEEYHPLNDADAGVQANGEAYSHHMEHGDSSTLHIPEAWAVDSLAEEDEEAYIASHVKPIIPWYEQKQSRIYTWSLLCFFSAIALTTYKTNPNYNPTARYRHYNLEGTIENFLTPFFAVSITSSAVASLIHVSGDNTISRRFVGTMLEAISSLILAIFWLMAIWMIMSAPYELGVPWVDGVAVIKDANLFFSSWGALVCTGINFALYLKKWQRKMSDCIRRSCTRTLSAPRGMGMGYTIRWSLLALASGVVLVLSISIKCIVCLPDACSNWTITSPEGRGDDATCSRNEFGIITGSIGLAVSIPTAFLSLFGQDSPRTTAAIGLFMTANFIVCAAMLCFGMGPANYVGNQYLSTWSGAFLSLHLFGGGLKEYLKGRGGNT